MMILYTLLVSFLPGQTTIPDDITSLVAVAQDCAIRRVGGRDIELCDLAPAFGRAADLARQIPDGWLDWGQRTGGHLRIPAGQWWLSHRVDLCQSWHVEGTGPGGMAAPTRIYVPHSSGGFRQAPYGWCESQGLGQGGASLIERLALIEATGTTATPTTAPVYGVEINGGLHLRGVYIRGFVQGVRVSADHNRIPASNANGWRLTDVRIEHSEHAGLSVSGGDANTGLALAPNTVVTCKRGSAWKPLLGDCAPQVYQDYLGSTIVGAHASNSNDENSGENFPNYRFTGNSQRSVCLGCYSESDAVRPVNAPFTTWIGGIANPIGGLYLRGPLASALSISNAGDPSNAVTLRMGALASAGTALEIVPSGGLMTQPLRLKAEQGTRSWRLDVANLNSAVALRIGGATAAVGGYGGVTAPKGIRLGVSNKLVATSTSGKVVVAP